MVETCIDDVLCALDVGDLDLDVVGRQVGISRVAATSHVKDGRDVVGLRKSPHDEIQVSGVRDVAPDIRHVPI